MISHFHGTWMRKFMAYESRDGYALKNNRHEEAMNGSLRGF